jgi:hypothetical protein
VYVSQVEFSPTLPKLAQVVNSIGPQLINTISSFKRLPDLLTHKHSQRKPVHAILGKDTLRTIHPFRTTATTMTILLLPENVETLTFICPFFLTHNLF